MTFEQKQEIRRILDSKLAALMQGALDVRLGVCADENEMASRVSEVDLKLAVHDCRRGWISDIEAALARIDHPEYGVCEECGEEIGVQRLRAKPTAALCIDCQSESERDAAA